MAKFDELLEQTYNTLGETSLTTGGVGGSQKAGTTSDADKLAALAAAAEDDEESKEDLKKVGKELNDDDINV